MQPSHPITPIEASERGSLITIVTGLPRSGTSLMMQMLEAAGLPAHSDAARVADEHNPRGYLEHAAVKELGRDASWLGEARGKALKVVAPLLPRLSREHRYHVVWMERDLDEVLASQAHMLGRSGRAAGEAESADAALRRGFEAQLSRARADLAERGASVLFVRYADAVRDPERIAREVCAFLGGDLDPEAAAAAVDPELYRQRRGPA